MAAQAATPSRPESQRLNPSLATLAHTVLVAATLMALLVSGWLVVRRVAGELHQPLAALPLIVVGFTIVILTSAARLAWHRLGTRPSQVRSMAMFLWLLPTVAALLLASALSIAGTHATSLLLFWSILLLGEGTWWLVTWMALGRTSQDEPFSPHAATATAGGMGSESAASRAATAEAATARNVELHENVSDEEDEDLPDEICQQLTRSNSERLGDTVAGLLRGHFQPGERSRSLHVAFCPPMKSQPSVEVIQLTGPQARVKAANIQSFGVRFDLRLAAPSQQEENVLIHFEARAGELDVAEVDER